MRTVKSIYDCNSIILIGLLILFIPNLYCQNFADKQYYLVDSLALEQLAPFEIKIIDSSLQAYHKASHDTLKIKAINNIVQNCWNDNIWIPYNQWVHDFSETKLNQPLFTNTTATNNTLKLFWINAYSDALSNIGYALKNEGDLVSALEYYTKSLEVSKVLDDPKHKTTLLNNIGAIYDGQGFHKKALEYYYKSLTLSEDINDKEGIAIAYNNIGYLFVAQDNNDKALEYYEKSLTLSKSLNHKAAMAHTLTNMGFIHRKLKDLPKALSCFKQSLGIQKEILDKNGMASTLHNLGSVYLDKNDITLALHYYTKSLEVSTEVNNQRAMALALNALGTLHFNQNDLDKAAYYSQKSLALAKAIDSPFAITAAAALASDVYKALNQWNKAFEMKELHIKMRDSVNNVESQKNVIRQQAKYEIEKKEQAITLMETENELQAVKLNRNKILINAFIVAFVLILILTINIYRGFKKKQLINELLEAQKAEISRKNEEKTAMLKEIHHRVKNNLGVVNSLLRLQSREIEDEKTLNMFKEAQKRVLSMALLHEKMYKSDDLAHIDIQEHIQLLASDLIKTYAVNKDIKLDISIEEIDIGLRTLVPLGLIINEIITNALKYAFNEKDNGCISLHIAPLDHKKFEMIIADDGSGYELKSESTGLGTKLIQAFTKQLNGSMKRINKSGTRFEFTFDMIS